MTEQSDNVIRFPGEPAEEIERTAALWLARMTSGSVTLGELAEFEYWRAASAEHDRVYREMDGLWDRLGAVKAAQSPYRLRGAGARPVAVRRRWAVRVAQVAAGVAAAVIGAQYLTTWQYEYHTAPGEIRKVTLADGSIVHLEGGAALNANVSDTGARVLELAKGEAFFEVVHDPTRPFSVIVGNGAVHDIGTGFSVARQGRSATVAVEHGVVAVVAGGRTDILNPGEQLSFDQYDMTPKTFIDTADISAWRRGMYVAEGKPLGEVLADIDEYHAGRIVMTSRALAVRRVNAVVQFQHIDAWLDALNETDGVSVRRWGPLIIVSDRKA